MSNFRPGVVDIGMPETHAATFVGIIVKHGINFLVVTPPSVRSWFGMGGNTPVFGLVNGAGVRATLVPKPSRRHSLFLNAEVRTGLAVAEGDEVTVTLWLDESDRSSVVPPDAETVFTRHGVIGLFEDQSASHQRMILVWIEDAKCDETRRNRIARSVEHLRTR